MELRRRFRLTSIPAQVVQKRLRRFGPDGELVKEFLLPTPPLTWRRQTEGQLKTWKTKIKAGLKPLSGP